MASGYRVGGPKSGNSSSPQSCVVTINNKELRDLIMRHKRGNIPPPSQQEKDRGVKRTVVVEDLTADTHRKLKELVDHKDFAKVWTINGEIQFTRAADPEGTVGKVVSPYLSVETILKK